MSGRGSVGRMHKTGSGESVWEGVGGGKLVDEEWMRWLKKNGFAV